jgi:hypothetical protein
VRLSRNFARRINPSLVGRHQAKMAIELIAPMTRKGAPPLGAESPPQLRQDQQTSFRALVRKLTRPKGDQARQVARPEITA